MVRRSPARPSQLSDWYSSGVLAGPFLRRVNSLHPEGLHGSVIGLTRPFWWPVSGKIPLIYISSRGWGYVVVQECYSIVSSPLISRLLGGQDSLLRSWPSGRRLRTLYLWCWLPWLAASKHSTCHGVRKAILLAYEVRGLVFWIGKEMLRLLPSSSRCRQRPFRQKNLRRVHQYKDGNVRMSRTASAPSANELVWFYQASGNRHTQRAFPMRYSYAVFRSLLREQGFPLSCWLFPLCCGLFPLFNLIQYY